MNVTITRVDSAEAHIRAPFELRELCKEIPSRTWNPTKKVWAIDADYMTYARNLFLLEGHTVHLVDERTAGRPAPQPAAATNWASALFKSLPEELHEKAFKALVKVVHPDAGGNTLNAQQLIDAYARRSSS